MMLVAQRRESLTIEVRIGKDFRRPAVLKAPAVRIGSHPSCELRLSDAYAPPHLATIERKDGDVFIHNTSGQVIHVGGEAVAAEASRLWVPGDSARLNAWVEIVLPAGSEPLRPRPAKKAEPTNGMVDPDAKPKGTSRDAASFGLAAVLLVVCGWLWLDPTPPGPSAGTRQVAALIQAAHADAGGRGEDPRKVDLCLQIQAGRAAQLRGDAKRARKVYEGVRDALLAGRPADGKFADPWDDEAFQFVRNGLNSL